MRITGWYCSLFRKKEKARDYYIRATLNHMWCGQDGQFDRSYVKQFDFVKELPSGVELPFGLTAEEKKRYKIKSLADITGKEFELKVGEACPFFTSLTEIKAYGIYSPKTLSKDRAYFISEVGLENPGMFSWRKQNLPKDKPFEDSFKVNDQVYKATIKLNKKTDTYTIKFTQE